MIRIAHRGASGYKLENSMAAFKKAIELGIEVIELDVQQTADGEFVVFHDHFLDRCTDTSGRINSYTLDHLREKIRLNNGEPIPEISEVCRLFEKNEITTLIELKNDNSAEDLFEIVKELLPSEKFIIGSFFHKQILKLNKKFPSTQTCFMFEGHPVGLTDYLREAEVDFSAVGIDSVSNDLVKDIQAADVKALVWTVNDPIEIAMAKTLNFDGIISNYPDRI